MFQDARDARQICELGQELVSFDFELLHFYFFAFLHFQVHLAMFKTFN